MKEVKMSDEEKKWKAESDARTLQEAEAIKGDKERMKAAMETMGDKMKQMAGAMMSLEEKAQTRFPNTYNKKEE